MDLQLKDRVIFVAGASRGIGLGIVEACLAEGAKVAMTARGAESLEESRARLAGQYGAGKLWAMAGDMRDAATIETALERCETELGPIWGAVANVGLYPTPPGFDIDDENWDAAFSQNLDSAFRLARPALKRMTARGEGSLLFISSIASLGALGTALTYGVAKAAMNHLSKELSKLAAAKGVRVNTIAPGNIIFPGGAWEANSTGPRAEAWARWIKREVPMNRYGGPEEIGKPAAFLLSPAASFLTGAVIPVDGGQNSMNAPMSAPAPIKNRITEMLGVKYPIVQAPMGWIARAQLASAVSNAGGLGIIETSSGELDAVRLEIGKMRELTDKPFGVNIAHAFVRDETIIDFVIGAGVKFVTTSAGDPAKYCKQLKAAGLTVFHVVPTLRAALKAVDAGVDGLIVEGGEGGGFKNPQPVMSMVLLPLVRENVDVPIIAAGGFADGPTMAAAFALGAEGVQMGTRMVASAESPVHPNWKQAIIDAAETDTVFLNQFSKPALRALRTQKTSRLEHESGPQMMAEFGHAKDLYFGGDMEASIALSGQVCGRINAIEPVAKIIGDTMTEFQATMDRLAGAYARVNA